MRKFWLLFSQTVTVFLAAYFVVATLQPQWLNRPSLRGLAVMEAPTAAGGPGAAPAGSFAAAAKAASGAVVSIIPARQQRATPT